MAVLPDMIDSRLATGKKILIVGAGTSGLLLALESHRLGWEPTVLELREAPQLVGDFIVIGPSAVKIFRHWPRLQAEYEQKAHDCDAVYHRHTGEFVLGPVPLKKTTGKPMLRYHLQQMLEDAVARQNIPVKYNHKVESYFETPDEGGVVLANGQRVTADVVAACDGVHSKSWTVISKVQKEPINSGHAVYRTAVPADKLFEADPNLKAKFDCSYVKPHLYWFSGPETHAIVFNDGNTLCWSIHHPANPNTSSESWSAHLEAKTVETQMLEQDTEWDPLLLSLVRNSVGKNINDWLLLFRDPDPTWVSPEGRIVLCGDSAHPFLPTSANGAVQAMEDAASLAAALRLGIDRSASIKESLEVYNQIRFPRTSSAQLMGIVHRQVHHKTDWDFIRKNPQVLAEAGPGKWIAHHDPEIFMQENFSACLASVRDQKTFQPQNTPPGYDVKLWTCEEIFAREKREDMLHLEGDWQ